jgi:hypothetical protein
LRKKWNDDFENSVKKINPEYTKQMITKHLPHIINDLLNR